MVRGRPLLIGWPRAQHILGVRAQDRGRADDQEVSLLDEARSGSQDVLKLLALHRSVALEAASENDVRMVSLSLVDRTPAKGEFARSSRASGSVDTSVRMTASGPRSSRASH